MMSNNDLRNHLYAHSDRANLKSRKEMFRFLFIRWYQLRLTNWNHPRLPSPLFAGDVL